MASVDDVRKLAQLARVSVDDAELEKFANEFEGILAYVGQIDCLSVSRAELEFPLLRNVFREDGEPHERRRDTEKLSAQFPAREGDSLSVKQIISYD